MIVNMLHRLDALGPLHAPDCQSQAHTAGMSCATSGIVLCLSSCHVTKAITVCKVLSYSQASSSHPPGMLMQKELDSNI